MTTTITMTTATTTRTGGSPGGFTPLRYTARLSVAADSMNEPLRPVGRRDARIRPRVWARLEANPQPYPLTGAARQRMPTSRAGRDEPDNPGGFSPGRGAA
ncbi:hypothetical protein GCM10009679_01790 [Saccharothrix algeriensis]|uniref:Uncharacterized protein n=1 Tax=Catellatospora bangladeshensis TaxID=310355 RepID=A0A8J3J9A5_9ACTN|nr:hypothetical protein Cba03nite_20360 [Catellatospora bangladeshensis]